MSSTVIHLTEPHPSIPKTNTIRYGRGGAGNYASTTSPSSTSKLLTIPPPSSSSSLQKFTSGRGGAGNVHLASERAMFSFDEELERQRLAEAPIYHVGRGGVGNAVDERNPGGVSVRGGASVRSMGSGTSRSDASITEREGGVKKSFEWVREMLRG